MQITQNPRQKEIEQIQTAKSYPYSREDVEGLQYCPHTGWLVEEDDGGVEMIYIHEVEPFQEEEDLVL